MITIGILFICSGCNHTSKQIEIHPNVQKQSEQVSESLSNFSISTFASLFHEHENLLYAPFPAYVTLVQTMCDARQETKTEIMQVLRYDGEEDTLITQLASTISSIEKKDVLHSANSIWYHPDVHISSDLLNCFSQLHVQQFQKDFQKENVTETSKQWLDEHLNRLDSPALPITKDCSMFYLSTLSFKDGWHTPFDQKHSDEQTFTTYDDKQVSTRFMHQTLDEIAYRNHNVYEAIALPFQNGCKMNIYLPKDAYQVEDILIIDAHWLDPITTPTKTISLSLPIFSHSQSGSMKSSLQTLGMKRAFSSDLAQFSSTDRGHSLAIGDILQGANISINEFGVEASSYEVLFYTTGIAQTTEPILMNVDHPFIYSITSKDGIPLFIGYVQDPTTA